MSLVSLLLAISKGQDWGWVGTKTIGLSLLGVVALLVFVLVELRVREPLVNMRLVAIRGVWAADLVALAFGFAMFGAFLLMPVLLVLPQATGYGFGKTVSEVGLFLLPMTVTMVVFGPLSGLLDRRHGPKLPLTLGGIALTAAFAPAAARSVGSRRRRSGLVRVGGLHTPSGR